MGESAGTEADEPSEVWEVAMQSLSLIATLSELAMRR